MQTSTRRDTVGSVSDDDSKMVICEDGAPDGTSDASNSKAGKWGEGEAGAGRFSRPSSHVFTN